MKSYFSFVGLYLNTIVQEKTPETCTFHGWCFKMKEHQNMKCWNSVVVFPSPNKISDYVPGSTGSIYQKIWWFFYLIYVVIISSSIFYSSELTKIWIDYHNFWA